MSCISFSSSSVPCVIRHPVFCVASLLLARFLCMMPHYKLTYFHIRGKGEYIRIAFAVAGVELEDYRVKSFEEWLSKLKPSGISPSGQLPVLEFDGKVLTQSKVILSLVAKEFGLAPEDNFQLAQADMLATVISELEDALSDGVWEEDAERKKKKLEKMATEVIPEKCRYFQKILVANSSGGGYLVGDKLSHADIVVFTFLNSYMAKGKAEGTPDGLKEFPALCAWYELIRTQPKILAWLKNPPADLQDYIY